MFPFTRVPFWVPIFDPQTWDDTLGKTAKTDDMSTAQREQFPMVIWGPKGLLINPQMKSLPPCASYFQGEQYFSNRLLRAQLWWLQTCCRGNQQTQRHVALVAACCRGTAQVTAEALAGLPDRPMASRVVGVAAVAVFGLATVAFVAPSSGARRLRAPVAQPAAFGASAPSGTSGLWTACSLGGVVLAVGAAVTRRAESKEIVVESIPRPEDLLESPKFPMFEGSTGGYMSRSTRERHAITWTAKDQNKFEMPTGGFAIMNKGENLCYFRKKEQCISLGKQLRKMKIENYKIYRLKKDGTVIFMHPADGVFPEKVNKGRVQVNGRPFTIRGNPQQSELKWTKYHMKSYEADPLTTLFIKARVMAFQDIPNLFALPQPNMEEMVPVEEVGEYTKQEYTTRLMEARSLPLDLRRCSIMCKLGVSTKKQCNKMCLT